jgi:uncharacterized surface protein with fasciclin (FAS1) repeats
MKSKLLTTFAILSAGALLITSCKKSNDIVSPTVNKELEKNKQQLHSTLLSNDLASRVPGDWWWADEYSTAVSSTSRSGEMKDTALLTSFTFLDSALKFTGLDNVLADPNTLYTVFAPSDKAFMNAGFATIDDLTALGVDALSNILLYHVVSGKVFSTDIAVATNTEVASLQTASLFLTKKENPLPNRKVLVNGCGVYIADVDLGNGVMHDINRVLIPPSGTVVDAAIANPDLTYLVAAVLRASQGSTDVLGVLSGTGPFTLFAPNNQAFINAGFATIEDINAADPDVLASILTYHVVAARVFACDVRDGDMPTMLDGNTTLVDVDENGPGRFLQIKGNSNTTGSYVYKRNLVSTNGVVHLIDQVLLP